MSQYIDIPELRADVSVVKPLTDRLLETFQQFADEFEGELGFMDGFMAAHNFHRVIVEGLVEMTGSPVWFDLAVDTFKEGVGRAREKGKKGGGDEQTE